MANFYICLYTNDMLNNPLILPWFRADKRRTGDEEMKYATPTKEEIGMAEMKEEEALMRGEKQ